MTTPNHQPTPPPGYQILLPEEYKKPTPPGTLIWLGSTIGWAERNAAAFRAIEGHIYAIPITPTVPATGDTTNEKGGEPCASTTRNAPATAPSPGKLIQSAQPTDASNAPAPVQSLSQGQELLPCPFCRNTDIWSGWNGSSAPGMEDCGYWSCGCAACGIEFHADEQNEAEEKWNTRK